MGGRGAAGACRALLPDQAGKTPRFWRYGRQIIFGPNPCEWPQIMARSAARSAPQFCPNLGVRLGLEAR